MGNQNQNGIIEGNNTVNTGATKAPKKTGLKTFFDGLHRKYDAIRYSKAGKWTVRALTALTIGGVGKVAYDKGVQKGKASVTPTVVTIEPINPAEETTEAPAEEKEMETAE